MFARGSLDRGGQEGHDLIIITSVSIKRFAQVHDICCLAALHDLRFCGTSADLPNFFHIQKDQVGVTVNNRNSQHQDLDLFRVNVSFV